MMEDTLEPWVQCCARWLMADLEKNLSTGRREEKCLIHLFDSLFFPKFKSVNVCQYFNGNYIFNMELIWQLSSNHGLIECIVVNFVCES